MAVAPNAFLVQILVPLPRPFASTGRDALERIKQELTALFGGVTAYTRGPAEGLWLAAGAAPEQDDIVVVEVMTETLDRKWWSSYRHSLEDRLQQEELVIRALPLERL